jgi:hypothetical protein
MRRVVAMRADSDDRVDTYEFTDEAQVTVSNNGSTLELAPIGEYCMSQGAVRRLCNPSERGHAR